MPKVENLQILEQECKNVETVDLNNFHNHWLREGKNFITS